jgi:hypothetical protein
MAKLIYSNAHVTRRSHEDEHGRFGWGASEDEEVHSYINQLASPFGTYLNGRRMYDTMVYWEAAHTINHGSCSTGRGSGRRRRKSEGDIYIHL